jgi:hypothetical protein
VTPLRGWQIKERSGAFVAALLLGCGMQGGRHANVSRNTRADIRHRAPSIGSRSGLLNEAVSGSDRHPIWGLLIPSLVEYFDRLDRRVPVVVIVCASVSINCAFGYSLSFPSLVVDLLLFFSKGF